MKRKLSAILSAIMLCALCVAPASALECSIDGADDYLFGRPTSDDTIYEWEDPNVDRTKNTALIPPGFAPPPATCPTPGSISPPTWSPVLSAADWSTRWAAWATRTAGALWMVRAVTPFPTPVSA